MIGVLWPLLLRAASATTCDDDAATLLQNPVLDRGVHLLPMQRSFGHEYASRTFMGLISVVLMFTVWEFAAGFSKGHAATVGVSDQWWLIIMSAMIQVGPLPIPNQLVGTWLKLTMVNSTRKTQTSHTIVYKCDPDCHQKTGPE